MPQLPKLPRPTRRAVLVVHVTVSVGWLGISLCLLALAIAGARDPDGFAEPACLAMKLFADWLLLPVALLSLGTGLVLSLGTAWGLARYRWVYAKFWLTLAATGLTVFSFKPGTTEAAAMAAAGETVPSTGLLFPPAVSLSLYAFLTAVSVLKPWGLTRRGRRLRASRTARTGEAAGADRSARGPSGQTSGAGGKNTAGTADTARNPVAEDPSRQPA